jgi:hypothetical protein
VSKSAKATWLSSATEPTGFYHFALGRDVSSSAAVAAAFAEMVARVEQPTTLVQVSYRVVWFAWPVALQA